MSIGLLVEPERLWTAQEVCVKPSPLPASSGVYGWWFDEPLGEQLPAGRLLYVGIAPRQMSGRTSRQNLRGRVRYHYRGNAEGSTLRLSLGCLLGLELRRVGSGKRMTFRRDGEAHLTAWMADHAHVSWQVHPEPWLLESELIVSLDLPLNLAQNAHNPFHDHLKQLRAIARQRAKELPVSA